MDPLRSIDLVMEAANELDLDTALPIVENALRQNTQIIPTSDHDYH